MATIININLSKGYTKNINFAFIPSHSTFFYFFVSHQYTLTCLQLLLFPVQILSWCALHNGKLIYNDHRRYKFANTIE